MTKDAYYFSHDSNSQQDPKIIRLIMNMKMTGYGIFWSIVENLRNDSDYKLNLSDCNAIAFGSHCEESDVVRVIKEFGLFEIDENGNFWSNSLLERMKEYDMRRDKARASANYRWHGNANAMPTHSEGNAIKYSKVKEIKESNIGRFAPPTQEQVIEYFTETLKATKDQAITFFEFYGSKGWVVGKAPMKNWHLAASRSLKWATNTTTQVKKYESKPFPTNA